MSLDIKIVPHPSKIHVTLPDKRGLFWCETCQEKTAEPFNRPQYRKVKCDTCKQPCEPLVETLFRDQMGISVQGAVIAYCKAEPDGWMARCQSQPLADSLRADIKAVVDAKYGGDAVWTDGSMVVVAPDAYQEDDEEPEDEPTVFDDEENDHA